MEGLGGDGACECVGPDEDCGTHLNPCSVPALGHGSSALAQHNCQGFSAHPEHLGSALAARINAQGLERLVFARRRNLKESLCWSWCVISPVASARASSRPGCQTPEDAVWGWVAVLYL
ncbi:hypothetical protein IHE44_0002429 [Lamprotornis superbus]|uniref:Uncharacterized protein n=1 Tax=Lamprotornis superbus TaxID=245042 RepID=A0A835U0B2_9PASS|nr:hypothetical protein IHE44_0002429 [Lamprotornis superbus]